MQRTGKQRKGDKKCLRYFAEVEKIKNGSNSAAFETKEEAEACKKWEEELRTCTVKGDLIMYKVIQID